MEYPQHGKRLATGSRQLPLIFPGNNPAVNLTQQERHYRPDEWSFPDSEAGHESRASGTTDDRYGSQHGRHYREPQSSINPLRNCPFKIPAFKEQARVNGLTDPESRRNQGLTCLRRFDRRQWTARLSAATRYHVQHATSKFPQTAANACARCICNRRRWPSPLPRRNARSRRSSLRWLRRRTGVACC
jgi:hypothetical protein